MKDLGYYNGSYGLIDEMSVPMSDRACFFGDAVYDVVYGRNYIPFALDEHIERFYSNLKKLDINIPCNKQELKVLILDLMKKVDNGNQIVYFQVSRGVGKRSHSYDDSMCGKLWVMIQEKSLYPLNTPVSVLTSEDKRYSYCNIKTINLIPAIIASKNSELNDCYDTIFYKGNLITEGSHSNVHILNNNSLITPPSNDHVLDGIARKHLIKACKNLNVKVIERNFTREEMFNSDEILLSSAGALCLRVNKCDAVDVGGKQTELVKIIQKNLYDEFLNETSLLKGVD